MFDSVCIVGVGLIGGSFGIALRERKLAKQVVGAVRRQISAAVDVVVQVARRPGGRRAVVEVAEVGAEPDDFETVRPLLLWISGRTTMQGDYPIDSDRSPRKAFVS